MCVSEEDYVSAFFIIREIERSSKKKDKKMYEHVDVDAVVQCRNSSSRVMKGNSFQ